MLLSLPEAVVVVGVRCLNYVFHRRYTRPEIGVPA